MNEKLSKGQDQFEEVEDAGNAHLLLPRDRRRAHLSKRARRSGQQDHSSAQHEGSSSCLMV
jgi:hypothetical protein